MTIAHNENETVIDTCLLPYGDTMNLLADSRLPRDSIVVNGVSEVGKPMITGKANLILKYWDQGSFLALSIVKAIPWFTLTRLHGESIISHLAKMTESAMTCKAKGREIADCIVAWLASTSSLFSTFAIGVAFDGVLSQ